MESGRLEYTYRLSAARLTILRMRFARRWHRLFQIESSTGRISAVRVLTGMLMLVAMTGSAWLGYGAGHPAHEPPTTASPVAASAPLISATPEPSPIDAQVEEASIAELANLRKTVGELQAQLQALEQEATGLELELLEQQIVFAKAEERWKEASVERRIVYNITNIPVGGAVSQERIESDAEAAELPSSENDFEAVEFPSSENDFNDQADSGENGSDFVNSDPSSTSSPTSYLPTDDRTRQEIFFGPAEDRSADWTDP